MYQMRIPVAIHEGNSKIHLNIFVVMLDIATHPIARYTLIYVLIRKDLTYLAILDTVIDKENL
jgi:hypothetical protein